MIQRSLLRQIRASGSLFQKLPISSASRPFSPALRTSALSSRQQRYPQCYSTTAEAKASTEGSTTATEEAPTESKEEEDPIKKELEAKKAEVIDLKDKYLRSVADFRNLQSRTKRETASAKDFAITRFAQDLIESIDNLDRALSTVPPSSLTPSNKDLLNLHQGLEMTAQILMQTLRKHGLERFDPSEKGEKFDPNVHEAAFMMGVEGKEEGTVVQTLQKGFLLNGRVIRAAKVGVVKNS